MFCQEKILWFGTSKNKDFCIYYCANIPKGMETYCSDTHNAHPCTRSRFGRGFTMCKVCINSRNSFFDIYYAHQAGIANNSKMLCKEDIPFQYCKKILELQEIESNYYSKC